MPNPTDDDLTNKGDQKPNEPQNQGSGEDLQAKVDAAVAEALKDVKAKLNSAYAARDEAAAKVKEFEAEKRTAEIQKLKDEGKLEEAHKQELAAAIARAEKAEAKVLTLTRDIEVRTALSGLELRNEKASSLAFKEVVSQVIQDDKGNWVHKSGVSIPDFIKAFSADEENAFMFKPKNSSGGGGGSGPKGEPPTGSGNKSIKDMTPAEIRKAAEAGTLRRRPQR